jgi:hypothetical protein
MSDIAPISDAMKRKRRPVDRPAAVERLSIKATL